MTQLQNIMSALNLLDKTEMTVVANHAKAHYDTIERIRKGQTRNVKESLQGKIIEGLYQVVGMQKGISNEILKFLPSLENQKE